MYKVRMVCEWKPDCSRELNDPRMPDGGPSVVDHVEDSDPEDEMFPAELGHYQLLPSDMQQGLDQFPGQATDSSDSDDDSDVDAGDNLELGNASSSEPSAGDQVAESSGPPTQHKLEGWEKTEIQVDSDEIRSLMRGFSLPDSAVPEWASRIPESMFISFVRDRIKPN